MSSSTRLNNGSMSHFFVFWCRFIKGGCRNAQSGNTQSETSTLLGFPRDDYCIIRSGGKPHSLMASPFSVLWYALVFPPAIKKKNFLNASSGAWEKKKIKFIPSWYCSCQIWSDPVWWKTWWGGWWGETQAAICSRGPAMEGPDTSRSSLTGTCTLPASRTHTETHKQPCFKMALWTNSVFSIHSELIKTILTLCLHDDILSWEHLGAYMTIASFYSRAKTKC